MPLVNPLEIPDWDARLATIPGASFFHTQSWLSVLHDCYGFRPACFAAGSGADRAFIPIMEVDSFLTGRRGVSLPFTDHCDPIGFAGGSLRTALNEILAHGRGRGWKYVEFHGSAASAFHEPATPSLTFLGHRLRLAGQPGELFTLVDPSVRRAVRKAEKAGVEVEFANSPEAMREYYRLHCLTRKRHGVPPQSFRFFRVIQEQVLARGQGTVASARHEGRVIAAAVFFQFGSEAIYKFGASDRDAQNLRPNNLVMWSAIKRFARAGFEMLDFGRTSMSNEGLRRFKLGWGAEERAIPYFKYNLRTGTVVSDRDEARGWKTGVFRLLPIPVARMIGAMLYRHAA